MIDVKHQINAVRREVGSRVLEAGDARVITVSQTYKGDLDDVWDAVTNPERLPRWFAPVSGDLQLGGRFQVEGNASGTIERCDPPNGFSATWEFGGETSWIEVRLSEESAGQIRFELEHVAHVDDERWAQFGPGAAGVGWDLALVGLARHLAGAEPVDREQAEAWTVSDEGRQFITLSGRLWGQASIADGDSAPDAEAAAERTIAFYTGT